MVLLGLRSGFAAVVGGGGDGDGADGGGLAGSGGNVERADLHQQTGLSAGTVTDDDQLSADLSHCVWLCVG